MQPPPTIEFEVALSFAGEDRNYVDQVANLLRDAGVKVFYDLFEEASLWGKDLYVHLSEVYLNKAQFTVMFISEHYARKLWTNHERRAMQARAFAEHQEYILPARFDDTPIPGILSTVGYISLVSKTPQQFVSIVEKKLLAARRSGLSALAGLPVDANTSGVRRFLLYKLQATRSALEDIRSQGTALHAKFIEQSDADPEDLQPLYRRREELNAQATRLCREMVALEQALRD